MNQEQRLRIYGLKQQEHYQRELDRLQDCKICTINKELIIEFHNHLFSKGCSELRVVKLSSQLRRICLVLDKPLNSSQKKDIERVITYYNIKHREQSQATFHDYVRCIKQFYSWHYDEYENIDIAKICKHLKKLKTRPKIKQADFRNIITDDEIDFVINKGATSHLQKAFLKTLHESGMRCSEILSLKIKDLTFRNNILQVRVPDGKTGEREIILVHSIQYLLSYLQVHPFKDNFDSFLWIGTCNRYKNKPIGIGGAQKIVHRCFNRSKLNKKHNLHWFRHSRATILAPQLTEVLLCKYMGWVIGSDQIKRYVHLSQKHLDDAILKINGIQTENVEEIKKSISCICGSINTISSRYCFKCGKPLSVGIAIQDKEILNTETSKTIQVMIEFAQKPELWKKFQDFKKQTQ